MNVLLIYPLLSRRRAAVDENKQFWPPLGLAYLASVLEENAHKVRILDRDLVLRKNDIDFDVVDRITLDVIRELRPAIVGISLTTPNMPDVAHVASIIRANFPNTKIVVGGPHPTGEPEATIRDIPEVDFVVRGEGEYTLLELAENRDPASVKGITYRGSDCIVSNPDRDLVVNIDALPLPARHLLDMKFYTRPSRFTSRNLSLRTTSIFTARGCPYRCSFCAGPFVFSGKVRFHSPDRVIHEIEELINRYDIEALYFAEDMFLSSKKRAEELLGLFIERGIHNRVKWIAQAKASIINEELLILMKRAGCVGVEYGFESGSQRVLDLMNKRQKVEESVKAAELTRKAGIRFQANIITGYPGERVDDFRQTLKFIRKIRPNMIGFNIFMPLPGTPSYEKLKAEGKPLLKWEDVGDQEASQINYADMMPGEFERLYLKARLDVILPINLKNFIKDNIGNPVRLIKIAFTQFGGVIVKAVRMSARVLLRKIDSK